MTKLTEIIKKTSDERSNIERCIIFHFAEEVDLEVSEAAVNDLHALQARIADNDKLREYMYAFFDIVYGNESLEGIQEISGLNLKRCREILELFNNKAYHDEWVKANS